MARSPFPRSSEFAARLSMVLQRTNVVRQKVARHLEKVYGSPDFRAFEGKLMRYAKDGIVPPPHDLDAVLRPLVRPEARLPEVRRWCYEGGDEPDYTVISLDERPSVPTPAVPVRAAAPAGQPGPGYSLDRILEAFSAKKLTLQETSSMIVGLSKMGLLDTAATGTSSSSCRSTPPPPSSKRGEVILFPSVKRLSGDLAK